MKTTACFKIGIAGPKGSGKSYLARWLCDYFLQLGILCEIKSFAYPVKKIASYQEIPYGIFTSDALVRVPIGFLMSIVGDLPQFPAIQGKNRQLLQHIGQKGRSFDPDIWVTYAQQSLPTTGIVIFDDLRYANETLLMDYVIEIDGTYTHEHESETANWRIYDGDWYYRDITIPQRSSLEPILKDFYEKVIIDRNTHIVTFL